MNELIQISGRQIGGDTVRSVNARDLHAFLDVGRDFSNWIKSRIEQYGFSDGQDYVTAESLSTPNLASAKSRPQVVIDYHLSIDMAKELAMVERNDKGKQAREYFIACERRAVAPATADLMQALNNPAMMRGLLLSYTEKVMVLGRQVEELAPKAEALDRISASEDAVTITQAAKLLGVKQSTLTHYLQTSGWVYRQNGAWVPYDKHVKNGRLQFKEARYTNQHTGQIHSRPYCHILPKGLALLALDLNTKRAA